MFDPFHCDRKWQILSLTHTYITYQISGSSHNSLFILNNAVWKS